MSSTEQEKRHKKFEAAIKEILSSKDKAIKFMQDAGIFDKNGHLAPMYK
jgi:hypothetical protein